MELLENHNEKNKFVVGLWKNISKSRGEILPLTEMIDWIDVNKEMRSLYHRKDKRRTWINYEHHN